MGFFICKSDIAVKVIPILIFWGIWWLYEYKKLTVLDGSKDHEDEVKTASSAATMPIASNVAHKQPQATPLVVAERPRRSQSTAIAPRKSSFNRKRKLFRNALLMDTLMHRKDCIT